MEHKKNLKNLKKKKRNRYGGESVTTHKGVHEGYGEWGGGYCGSPRAIPKTILWGSRRGHAGQLFSSNLFSQEETKRKLLKEKRVFGGKCNLEKLAEGIERVP